MISSGLVCAGFTPVAEVATLAALETVKRKPKPD
jgi:hypothetical protein